MNRIGLLGYGTVGKGVYQLVKDNKDKYDIEITKVLMHTCNKGLPEDIIVYDYKEICANPNIDIVIECLGGDDLPYKAITLALKNKKSVITSNKETVSLHLNEYLELAKENNVFFLFEASVGGGIPLIYTMLEVLKYDSINSFDGILNGTTNYIITKMYNENMDFSDALKLAQENHFAEANPTADIEGLDMIRKGVILSSLAYQGEIDVNSIPHFGISNLTLDIIKDIKAKNYYLKFIVSSSYKNNKLSLVIMPALLNSKHPLIAINDEFNGIKLDCLHNGPITLIGKGAGMMPTASAIMQDLMKVLNKSGRIDRHCVIKLHNEIAYCGEYYVVKNNQKEIIKNPSEKIVNEADFIARII